MIRSERPLRNPRERTSSHRRVQESRGTPANSRRQTHVLRKNRGTPGVEQGTDEGCSRTAPFEGWIYRGYGVPQTILSDQGSNVDGETFREFCKALGVDKKRTSPYRPQSTGCRKGTQGW